MAEELILADPIQPPPPPSTTKYRISAITWDLEMVMPPSGSVVPPEVPAPPEPGFVNVKVKDNNGGYTYCQYIGQEAHNMIKWLNTANFTTNSMQKRVLQKLMADGKLPLGTVQGTPESPASTFKEPE